MPSRSALALHVARACARASPSAELREDVFVDVDPARIVLAWGGAVWLRLAPSTDDDDPNRYDADRPSGHAVALGRERQLLAWEHRDVALRWHVDGEDARDRDRALRDPIARERLRLTRVEFDVESSKLRSYARIDRPPRPPRLRRSVPDTDPGRR